MTTYTIAVEVEAPSMEEAEEKVWEMYNNEELEPTNTSDVDTNVKWGGYADE